MTEHETTPDQLRYIAKITAGRTAGGFSWDEVLEAAAAQLDQNRAEQRHADGVTGEPEWSTRPVPSSDTPSDERRPVDVTALPEWAALLAAHAEAVKAEEALDQALATGSSYNDPQEPFRVAAARWSRVSLMASSLIHAAAADRGDRADG